MHRVQVLAAEPSGDQLGAMLAAGLRELAGDRIELGGMGGPAMAVRGIEEAEDFGELAVMGLAEVVPKLPRLLTRIGEVAKAVAAAKPDAVVTIDSPDFMHRVVERARPLCAGTVFVNYVAPTVWMWRPGRARKVARLYDLQLALLPFETEFFAREGLRCEFVGHPAVEQASSGLPERAEARRMLGIDGEARVLAVLPGSRRSEVRRLGGVFGKALARLSDRVPDLVPVVPAAAGVEAEVALQVDAWRPRPVLVSAGPEEPGRWTAFAAADAALAASGTVTVELAAAGVPMVVAYRMAPSTWAVMRVLAKQRHASLVNLIADADVVPEFLQGGCREEPLARAAQELLQDSRTAARQRSAFAGVVSRLRRDGERPSRSAARAVLALLSGRFAMR